MVLKLELESTLSCAPCIRDASCWASTLVDIAVASRITQVSLTQFPGAEFSFTLQMVNGILITSH